METQLPQTFIEFLKLIGSPVFIGILISLLIREWVWLSKQKSEVKVMVIFLLCVGFPIVSQVVILYLPIAAVAFIEAWWPVVMVGVGSFIASQVWHDYTKNKIRQEPAATMIKAETAKDPDPANGLNMPG
jgi:hypothetical protein